MARIEPYPTNHSLQKMKDRAITWAEVVDIVERPEVVYGPDYQGRRILQKGDLSVVVGRDGAVVTVLLRSEEQWTDEEAKSRDPLAHLSPRELRVYEVVRDNPGRTTAEIVKLVPEFAKQQVESTLYTALQSNRHLIRAGDPTARPYRWYTVK